MNVQGIVLIHFSVALIFRVLFGCIHQYLILFRAQDETNLASHISASS